MLEVIKSRLINDWRQSWKFGSVWLHCVGTSSAFAYVYENPGALNNLLYGLPPQWRLPVFFTLGGIWFAFGWAVRIYKGKPNG
jgi:hypothetical protein